MGTKGRFDEVIEADTANMSVTDGGLAVYDSDRGKWLSASKTYFEFAKKGNAKGMYLSVLGDLDDSGDSFIPGKNATITSVFCASKAGEVSQGFEVHKNGSSIYAFAYDGVTRRYVNTDLNLDITATDNIQIYVAVGATTTKNPFCRLEVGWRYDI